MTGGGKANKSGTTLEKIARLILRIAEDKGYNVSPQHRFNFTELRGVSKYPIKGVRVDFLVSGARLPYGHVIITSKGQNVPGSAEQKIHHEIKLIKEVYPWPTYLLMSGNGWGALICEMANNEVDGLLFTDIFNLEGLYQWCMSLEDNWADSNCGSQLGLGLAQG